MRFIRKRDVIGPGKVELFPDWSPALKQPDTRQIPCLFCLEIQSSQQEVFCRELAVCASAHSARKCQAPPAPVDRE